MAAQSGKALKPGAQREPGNDGRAVGERVSASPAHASLAAVSLHPEEVGADPGD